MKNEELLVYPQKKEDVNFNKGLTLRDKIAIAAMKSMLIGKYTSTHTDLVFTKLAEQEKMTIQDVLSKMSYEMADAMLKVRKDSSPD